MRRVVSIIMACAMAAAFTTVPVSGADAATGASAPQPGVIVSGQPAARTPSVMDGSVLSMSRAGDVIVVGGTFTTVRNAGSVINVPRRNIFAFSAKTGRILDNFAPSANGVVYKVLTAADGRSVYLGGSFTKITARGRSSKAGRLVKLSLTTGLPVSTFSPGVFNDSVRDLELTGSRLWVAGKFTKFQGRKQAALGTINAMTGRYDRYFSAKFTGLHRPAIRSSKTSVLAISADPTNKGLVVVGNFTKVNGSPRSQIAKLGLGPTRYSLANWRTRQYESPCSARFESYVSDVSYSPDGRYFVVATTGGYGGSSASIAGTSGCDVVARFEAGSSGQNVRPRWTAYTGGDTTWTIEVTQNVVYAGGHQRWQNNPTRGNAVGQGAVARTGIAALNPVNGLPYSWNPTRARGVGVKDMIATETGLYVGSDTDVFAGSARYKVAFLPLVGGERIPPQVLPALPGSVVRVPLEATDPTATPFDGTSAGVAGDLPVGPVPWGSVVGAFMINETLYTAYKDGSFTKQSFDGVAFGEAMPVDGSDKLARQVDWHNTDIPRMTSLFYSGGRMYFTRVGENALYSRAFEPESDIVGQQRSSLSAVPGVNYASVRGAFVVGPRLFFSDSSGNLKVASWSVAGPLAGTARVLPGAGRDWASRTMFVGPRS